MIKNGLPSSYILHCTHCATPRPREPGPTTDHRPPPVADRHHHAHRHSPCPGLARPCCCCCRRLVLLDCLHGEVLPDLFLTPDGGDARLSPFCFPYCPAAFASRQQPRKRQEWEFSLSFPSLPLSRASSSGAAEKGSLYDAFPPSASRV